MFVAQHSHSPWFNSWATQRFAPKACNVIYTSRRIIIIDIGASQLVPRCNNHEEYALQTQAFFIRTGWMFDIGASETQAFFTRAGRILDTGASQLMPSDNNHEERALQMTKTQDFFIRKAHTLSTQSWVSTESHCCQISNQLDVSFTHRLIMVARSRWPLELTRIDN